MAFLTAEQLDRAAISLRAGDYNLLLGAAASLGSKNAGNVDLPLADPFRLELCKLKSAKTGHSLQRIYQTLTADEVDQHVTARFSGSVPGPALRALPTFIWRRIFTLNIDDALEAAYATGQPYQLPATRNFRDAYEDVRDRSHVPIIHLHGFVQRPEDGYIFSREAYLQIIKSANPWMVVLSQLLASEPFFIVGSSLDEVDLDFFLSLRSQATTRGDRGPSILVEPFGDVVTDAECERLGLLRFPGTSEEFIEYIDSNIRTRPRPHELVPADDRAIFIEDISTQDVSSFYTDFEKVPAAAVPDTHNPRFFFGHAPTWSDLGQQYDIARPVNTNVLKAVESCFTGASNRRLVFLSDHVGIGKTTTLRRVGYDFARQGTVVLACSAVSRLEPKFTASMLDRIAGRCLVLVDDFADQVYSIESVLKLTTKSDLVFLAAERSYRHRFVSEVLAGTKFDTERSPALGELEAEQLINTYVEAGLVGSGTIITDKKGSISSLKGEPIAVACCRILNDLRPLDRIVDSLIAEANRIDRMRYLTAALAQYCTKSGIKFDLLIAASSGAAISGQFNAMHPLPLTYSEEPTRNYVVPLNGTLATRILEVTAERYPDDLFGVFVGLGKAIAPRVNRKTIVQRTPEARLAARLFDLDQVVERFLGDRAGELYEEVEDEWRWNSRYWEQVALLYLYRSQNSENGSEDFRGALDLAIGHARHAVSIERHPLTLTTLAKILFSEAAVADNADALLTEAMASVGEAISIEKRRNRSSVHPYMVLFQGLRTLPTSSALRESDLAVVQAHVREAMRRFPRDAEMQALANEVQERLHG
ncbi:hypothetical protein G7078_09085 [Sphingomonas sinipercae]|uniref:Novel STAND NTPase 5 domain-containing protein n=1 Tax=Sphingomonas sinipercae TaxID=2714944 RepID=A0A6G7ZPU2_9SPHN|nr:SIR2 family protein [Sphingomonas sinipercae]QIL02920.1 hypothetical protein G7078_09085 [Sphingomonas sinipercae]